VSLKTSFLLNDTSALARRELVVRQKERKAEGLEAGREGSWKKRTSGGETTVLLTR
jgi:hypothetical protein